MGKLTKVAFIPDVHVPYEDKKAVTTAINAIAGFGPEILVTLGDTADFYSVSFHDKSPSRTRLLEEEITAVNEFFSRLDAIKGVRRKIAIMGNHEYRLERYIMGKAQELFGLVAVRDLLKLKERGWEYVPYKEHIYIGKILCTHDLGPTGPNAPQQHLAAAGHSIVFGHTHRAASFYAGTVLGERRVAMSFGWLGDPQHIDYMHTAKAKDWAHGFGIGYLEPGGAMHMQVVPILSNGGQYRCVVEGVMYSPAGPHVAVPDATPKRKAG